jgi:hypothetical protein
MLGFESGQWRFTRINAATRIRGMGRRKSWCQNVESLEERTLLSFTNPVISDYPGVTGFIANEATGDFNGDGKVDLAVATYTEFDAPVLLTVLQGNGDGTFSAQTPITLKNLSAIGTVNLAAGRMNGDNADDLVVLNGGFEMKVFFGATAGLTSADSSTTALTLAFTTGISNPGGQLVLGHFQSPDKLDVAIFPESNNVMRLMTNQGDGTFTEQQIPLTFSSSTRMEFHEGDQAFAEDLNGDGLDDAVFTLGTIRFPPSQQSGILTVVKTNGPDVFKVSAVTVANQADELQAGLIDADGLLDLATKTANGAGGIQVFKGQPDGSFQAFAASPFTGGSANNAATGFVLGTFVGGPATDLVINPTNGIPDPINGDSKYAFGISSGQGDGSFSAPTFIDRSSEGSSESFITEAGRLVAADANSDGVLDLINLYPTFGAGRTSVLLNTGGTHTTLAFPDIEEGSPITIAATIDKNTDSAPGTPSGTVTFKEGSTILGQATIVDGVATSDPLFLSAGNHTISATYSGDDAFLSNVSQATTINVIVNPGRTKTTLTFPNLVEGQALISANISKYFPDTQGILDGTIAFMEGNQLVGQALVVGGQAAAPLDLDAGDHTLFAVYNGSGNGTFTKSTSAAYQITIATPPPPNLGLLNITMDNGGLKFNRANQHFEYSGVIHIGLAQSPSTSLLDLSGSISVGDGVISGQGTVTAHVGLFSAVLFNGSFQFNIGKAATEPFSAPSLPNSLQIGGLNLTFKQISLVDDGIDLAGEFTLPASLGGQIVSFGLGSSLHIGPNGLTPHFGTGGGIGLPDFDFNLAGLGITFSKISIDYDAPNDRVVLQGNVALPDLFGGFIAGPQIKLADENFIQIHNGQVGFSGDLIAKRIDIVPGIWYLTDVKLHLNTIANAFEGGGTLFIPGGIGIKANIGLINGQLDKVILGLDGLNVPVPDLPGAFLQSVAGGNKDLTKTTPTYLGDAGFTYLPAISFKMPDILGGQEFHVSLASLDLTATINSNLLTASGTVDLLKGVTGSGPSPGGAPTSVSIDWRHPTLHISTQIHLINNILDLGADFVATGTALNNITISFHGDGTINLPAFQAGIVHINPTELAGGHIEFQYSNDGDFSNDYAKVSGTVDLPIFGRYLIGATIYFNGHVDFIGMKDPVGQTFNIPAGTNRFMLMANWENAVGDVPVELVDPNGVVYTEADFDNTSIGVIPLLSGPTSKAVGLLNPIPGDWTIRVPNETGLGQVTLNSLQEVTPPTLEIADLTPNGQGVNVGYNSVSSETDAQVTFYYDTDNVGFNGVQLNGSFVNSGNGQSFQWDTTGVAAGTYYVYGRISDGINPSVYVYSPVTVTVDNAAPIVSFIADQTINEGDTLELSTSATDPNGDRITYSLGDGAPDGMDIDPATGEITWTPSESQGSASYTISVDVTDSGTPALTGIQTFHVTVNEVNSAPVLRKLFAQSTPQGGTISFTAGADDSDAPVQMLRFSLDPGAPAGATIDPLTGTFTWTPNASQTAGVYPVTIRVTDNGNTPLSGTGTVNLTVTTATLSVPGSINFSTDAYSVDEGGNAIITVTRTGGTDSVIAVQYAASGDSATEGLDFSSTTGILIFDAGATSQSFVVPALHDGITESAETVNLSLSNTLGGSLGDLSQAVLTINDVTVVDPIFVSPATFNVVENQTSVGLVNATDANPAVELITYSISGGTDAATFAISNAGALTFKTAPDFESPADSNGDNVYNLQVTATDGVGGTAVQNITVKVTGVNDNSPVFTSVATFNVAETSTDVGTVTATDADLPAQAISYSITGGDDQNKFVITNTGALKFVAAPSFTNPSDKDANNIYDLQVTANDGDGRTTVQNISVSVTQINAGPTITLAASAASFHLAKKPVPIAIDGAATFTPGSTMPSLAGAKLVITVSSNHASNDVLGILAGSTTDVHRKGKKFVVGKTVIGTNSGGKGKTPALTVTLTSAATSEEIEKIVQKISFSTNSAGTGPRTLQMHLNGSGGLNSNTATRQITVQ